MKFHLPFRPAADSAAASAPPGIFKLAVYAVEYALFRGTAAFFRHLPRPQALATGRALGGLAEKVMFKQRKIAQDNLRQAFPERSDQQIRQDVRAVFQHLGISAVELLRVDLFRGQKDVERYFSFSGWEHVREAYGLHRGVLVMTGHMGYWESGGFLFPQFGFPLDVVARRVKNPWVDRFITRLREAYGGQVLDSRKGARKILRSLAEGRGVAVLLDQHTARKEAVPVTFFGRQAWTTPIIAKIAMRQQIPILPVYSWRTPDFRYEVRVEPPIILKNEPGEEAIRRNTELLTASIEQAVRHNPIQWFWVHRRWRSYCGQRMNGFSLHGTLRKDCHILGIWQDIWVLLHRDAHVRWFILVPETDRTEWHELPEETRQKLALLTRTLSAYLKTEQHCDKINLGLIGNMVPQLHMHVIGRWKSDPYWPGVVWGKSQPGKEYTPEQVDDFRKIGNRLSS